MQAKPHDTIHLYKYLERERERERVRSTSGSLDEANIDIATSTTNLITIKIMSIKAFTLEI